METDNSLSVESQLIAAIKTQNRFDTLALHNNVDDQEVLGPHKNIADHEELMEIESVQHDLPMKYKSVVVATTNIVVTINQKDNKRIILSNTDTTENPSETPNEDESYQKQAENNLYFSLNTN